jgi:2-polyprenyl-3-methyl-5-hydroxy-6-metoxy-1,4-benzoquinol methylase
MEQLTQCLACSSKNYQAFLQTSAMMHEHTSAKYNFDRCQDCGLVFLNPRMQVTASEQFYTAAYLPYRVEDAWGKYASFVKQDQRNIDRARVKRLKQFHDLRRSSRVLDVGCGKPTFLATLRDEMPAQLIGLDFSDEGWKDEPEAYIGIDLRKGEIADLLGEAPVDVITMWHYLEHDYQPQKHLRQLLVSSNLRQRHSEI